MAALCLAGLALSGDLTENDFLAHIGQGDVIVVLNTLLCSFAVSLAVLFKLMHRRAMASGLFGLAMLISFLVLAERALHLGPVIDFPAWHAWAHDLTVHPGRMSMNSCVGYLLAALAGLAQTWIPSRRTSQLTLIAVLICGAIGLLGLLGVGLALDFLYHSIGLVQVPPVTALLLILAAISIWANSPRIEVRVPADDLHLNAATRIVVLSVVAITGLTAFAVTQRRLERVLGDELTQRLAERANFMATTLDLYDQHAQVVVSPAGLADDLVAATNDPSAAQHAALIDIIERLLPNGFSAIAYLDTHGAVVASLGQFHNTSGAGGAQIVPLASRSGESVKLGWDQSFYLENQREIRRDGVLVGFARSEQSLYNISRLTTLAGTLGAGAEVSLCTLPSLGRQLCFPTSLHDRPFLIDANTDREESILLLHASSHNYGLERGRGRAGEPVLAAYRVIADTGLVMLMTSDLNDIYAPVRGAFQSVLPILFVLCLAAILVVRWFIRPLVKQLLLARRAAERSEARFRAAAEGSLDALFLLEAIRDPLDQVIDFRFAYMNQHGERLLGIDQQAAGSPERTLCERVPQIRRSGWFIRYLRVLEGGAPISGNVMIQLPGMQGTWLHQHVAPLGDGIAVSVRDISAEKALEDRLRHAAQTDSLTGLPNRALLIDRIERALLRAARQSGTVALLYLDLDKFKEINDRYGHATGDAVLAEFSRRLSKGVRAEDTVARLGGDEFCILIESLSGRAEAFRIADGILLSTRVPINAPPHILRVTTSIGIAFHQAGEMSATAFIERADRALYQVKRRGRDGYFAEEQSALAQSDTGS